MKKSAQKSRITIATGIYPPELGGPAQYAEMLFRGFTDANHVVRVKTYGSLKKLPTGLRHLAYFFRLVPAVVRSDVVLVLDTFSAALPAVLVARLFRRKICLRVGGDFLWEEYVERTCEQVLLSHFYTEPRLYTLKEKIIFNITQWVYASADHIVFSTAWQRDITVAPYGIDLGIDLGANSTRVSIIENLYEAGPKRNIVPKEKIILSPSRNILLKNKQGLEKAIDILTERFLDISLDTATSSRGTLLQRIGNAYVLVVPSFSEVSPNIVIDAVRLGVPAVVTDDCGIYERLGDTVVWVNALSPQSIADGIATLLDASKYAEYMARLSKFSFVHTPEEIVHEFEEVIDRVRQ